MMSGDNPTPDELMMPVSQDHALRQSEILALRSISDGLALVNRSMEKMGDKLERIAVDVTVLKTQDVAGSVKKLESEFEAYKLIAEAKIRAAEVLAASAALEVERKFNTHLLDFARFKGIFVPVAVVAAALLASALSYLTGKLF